MSNYGEELWQRMNINLDRASETKDSQLIIDLTSPYRMDETLTNKSVSLNIDR